MFFPTHVLWTPHYETELELIQRHLDKGDNIIQAVCNAQLPTCDVNLRRTSYLCSLCITRRLKGKSLLSGKIKNIPVICSTAAKKEEVFPLKTEFPGIDELKAYSVENFDAGYAVASSLISLLRDPHIDPSNYKAIVKAYIDSAIALYRSVQHYVEIHKIDRVYVFNGRFAHVRAVFRACQSRGVECIIHERGHDIRSYSLYTNSLPHNLGTIENRIRHTWKSAPASSKREEIGARFFMDRAKGIEQSWYSYAKEQTAGFLPDHWDNNKMNIVIYNSSEDEFAAIDDEWKNPLYPSQLDAMKRILDSVERTGDRDIHIYLRMHPNMKDMPRSEIDKWHSLESRFLTIIPHDSPIDTYALLRHADKVLTFGSTVGIEAVFWGKPSILAGISMYKNLGGTYNPSSHEDLIVLLKKKLETKDNKAALMYGFYMSTHGIPFKYYNAEGIGSGKFKGIDLNKVKVSRFVLWCLMIKEVLRKTL